MCVCTCVCTCVCHTLYIIYICFKSISKFLHYMCLHEYPLFYFSLYYWSIIASEDCARFCCTKKWISCLYTYILLLREPPSPSYPTPLGQHSTDWVELPGLCSSLEKYLGPPGTCFTQGRVYMSIPASQFSPPSPSPTVSTRPFVHSLCLHLYFCPENRFNSQKAGKKYMYINKYPLDRTENYTKSYGSQFSPQAKCGQFSSFCMTFFPLVGFQSSLIC